MTTQTQEAPAAAKPEADAKTNVDRPQELFRGPIEIGRIKTAGNVRKHFAPQAMAELTESVKKVGVLHPIILRQNLGKLDNPILVAGERRLRAATAAGLKEIPCRILELTDSQAVEIQVIENADRKDLHPLEEAEGFRELLGLKGYTVARIAERLGRSVPYVYDRLKLLNLTKDLQKQFLEGKFSAAHAVILARLSAEDQKRATEGTGGLWEGEAGLFDPRKDDDLDEDAGLKPRSVKELQAWVDQHVRFDASQAEPYLFPEAAEAYKKLEEKAEKVVAITLENYVQPEAREDGKIVGPRSWLRADGKAGSKTCDHSVLGVIVSGPGRGESFRVCTSKEKCATHWGKWQKERKATQSAAAKGGAGQSAAAERWRKQQEEQERQQKLTEAKRKAWQATLPEVLDLVAATFKKLPAGPKSELAGLVEKDILDHCRIDQKAFGAAPKTADDFVRWLAFCVVAKDAHHYNAHQTFPKEIGKLGVNLKAVVQKMKAASEQAEKEPAEKGKA